MNEEKKFTEEKPRKRASSRYQAKKQGEKLKSETSAKKASSEAVPTEPSATQVVQMVRPTRKLSGMTKWAKMRCKKHGRKSVKKGGRR